MQFSLESLINNNGPKPTSIRESKRKRPDYYGLPVPQQKPKLVRPKMVKPKAKIDAVSLRIADAMLDYARRHEININVRGFKHG